MYTTLHLNTAATFTLTSPNLSPSLLWMNKKEEDVAINRKNNRPFGGRAIKSLINPVTMSCLTCGSGKIKLLSN